MKKMNLGQFGYLMKRREKLDRFIIRSVDAGRLKSTKRIRNRLMSVIRRSAANSKKIGTQILGMK